MKQSARRTTLTAKSSRSSKKAAASSSGIGTSKPLVTADPASKQQAAKQAGMFLYTDDAWSGRYWDSSDLHFQERELFG